MRRRHPFNVAYDIGEELFLRTYDSREVRVVVVFVNTSLPMSIDSFEQLTIRIGRLRLKRCGPIPALTIFVVYAPTSKYNEEEVEAFYMDLEKFYRENRTFFKVIIGDFDAKIVPRRTSEERHIGTHGLELNEKAERLSEFIIVTKTIHAAYGLAFFTLILNWILVLSDQEGKSKTVSMNCSLTEPSYRGIG
ncbi:unnamed protein product [Angiostrongylus costaricensis]|uniref:Uncharacterized protein n=1 Tax=Angiostrongylus costaricensis TaxID=334426 RepID=A0A0R3PXR7_ANGCS|nr:unnamed protein product [Angiostrongylus costaricensis]